MKIVNDVNNNVELVSTASKGDENSSLLGSLFTINFNSHEENSNKISDDFEFIFTKDEIEIIDYLSNILPNLNISNLNLSDIKSLKSQIQSDQSLKSELMKDKILNFLDTATSHPQNIFIKFPENQNFLEFKNKNMAYNLGNDKSKKENLKVALNFIKGIEQTANQSGEISPKANHVFEENNIKLKSEDTFSNQASISNKNKVSFVKKVKKNDHPNKLYQSFNSNLLENKEKTDSTAMTVTKVSKSLNLNYMNNQLSDNLKKNNINEIKANDKILNVQNLIGNNSNGNQFSQQNNNSLSNVGINSVLEGFMEILDLTQKGWTTKLVSRIENALAKGGEEIEFNLKPKNLGRLKVSINLKNGTGHVKIITENSFVSNALTQNENHLQKLFNDQGIDLEFSANDKNQYFGSKNSFTKNSNKKEIDNTIKSKDEKEQTNIKVSSDDNSSSRHIVNVIA